MKQSQNLTCNCCVSVMEMNKHSLPVNYRFLADPVSVLLTRRGNRAASVPSTGSARRRQCAGSNRRCVFNTCYTTWLHSQTVHVLVYLLFCTDCWPCLAQYCVPVLPLLFSVDLMLDIHLGMLFLQQYLWYWEVLFWLNLVSAGSCKIPKLYC